MFFGFDKRGDVIPKCLEGSEHKRTNLLFLTMFNSCVESEFKIPLKYAKFSSIKEMFTRRIDELLTPPKLKFNQATKLCITSNLILHSFYSNRFAPPLANIPVLKPAKLANMIADKRLIFSADELFRNFVFNKIAKIHSDKKVFIEDGIIYISVNDERILGVLPAFRYFDIDDKKSYEKEVKDALNLSQTTPRIYIALPRQKGLEKHIEIKTCDDTCSKRCIKIVPYSITNKVFIRKFVS